MPQGARAWLSIFRLQRQTQGRLTRLGTLFVCHWLVVDGRENGSEIFGAQRCLVVESHGLHDGHCSDLVCHRGLYLYLYPCRDRDKSRAHCCGRRSDSPECPVGHLSYPDESTSLAREISICCCYTSEIAYVVSGLEKGNAKASGGALRKFCSKCLVSADVGEVTDLLHHVTLIVTRCNMCCNASLPLNFSLLFVNEIIYYISIPSDMWDPNLGRNT